MKRLLIASCASLSLSGCMGSSSCGGPPPPPSPSQVGYSSISATWVKNHSDSVAHFAYGASPLELSLIDINEIHKPVDVALGILGAVQVLRNAPASTATGFRLPLNIGLFPVAQACSPVSPRFDAEVARLQILVADSTIPALTAGTDVSHLFSVVASQKEATEGYSLMDWNAAADLYPGHASWWSPETAQPPAYMANTMLIFSEPDDLDAGEITFTVIATRDDGETFTVDTAPITFD